MLRIRIRIRFRRIRMFLGLPVPHADPNQNVMDRQHSIDCSVPGSMVFVLPVIKLQDLDTIIFFGNIPMYTWNFVCTVHRGP